MLSVLNIILNRSDRNPDPNPILNPSLTSMYTNTAMATRDTAAAEMVQAPRVVCINSASDSFSFSS